MPQTADRRIGGNRLLMILIICIVLIAAAGGYYLITRLYSDEAARNPLDLDKNALLQPAIRFEPLSATFYYPWDGMLATGTVSAGRQPDTQAQARETLAALFLDNRAAQAPVLKDLRLRAFYLDQHGTAYIDLAPGRGQAVAASAWDEQLAIYAMVNTLTQNFEEIKQVAFLVDGKDAQTLAGHMDLSRMYMKRMDLVK